MFTMAEGSIGADIFCFYNRKLIDERKQSGSPLQVVIMAPYKGAETKDH